MYFHICFVPRRNDQTKTLVQASFISFSMTPSLFGYTCDYTMKMPKLEWVFLHRSFKKESHSLAKGLSCVASPESSSSSLITRSITYDKWPTRKALVHVSNVNFAITPLVFLCTCGYFNVMVMKAELRIFRHPLRKKDSRRLAKLSSCGVSLKYPWTLFVLLTPLLMEISSNLTKKLKEIIIISC